MPPRHVAFFRNLNLGQRGSPTRDELVTAFELAGATEVVSVQGNGTVVYRASAPIRTVAAVRERLSGETGWSDVAPVRRARWVLQLVSTTAEVGGTAEVSLYDASHDFPEPVPWRPPRGRVTVVRADRRHAVAVNDEPRTSNATPELERLLGLRVTSRGLATMQRLASRLD